MLGKPIEVLSYAYAGTGALSVILHPSLLSFLDFSIPGLSGLLASAFTWVFIIACLSGAIGMIQQRWWGFAGLYIATAVGSFGLAICMVPLVIAAFPIESRAIPLFVLNAAFIVGLAVLQITIRRKRRIAA